MVQSTNGNYKLGMENEQFLIYTNITYYSLLQELTYIRPLRMLSPAKFVGGLSNDPLRQNSCPTGWGNITDYGVTVN